MRRHLILFTAGFPYGTGETFLDAEIEFLAPRFDRMTILAGQEGVEVPPRQVPRNASAAVFQPRAELAELARCLPPRHLKVLASELKLAFRDGGARAGVAKILLADYMKSLAVVRHLARSNAVSAAEETYLYAYWHDYTAHAIALSKAIWPQAIAIARLHGWDVYAERHPFAYLPFKRQIFEGLDRSYAISEHGRRYALARFGAPAEGIRVARLGTMPILDAPPEKADGVLQVLSVSNLVALKRIPLLVEALSQAEGPVCWTHVGDGPERERVDSLARERLTPKPQVTFELTGYLEHHEVLTRMRALTNPLFVNVSSSEGIPVSIMEAMSAGIPSIGTDVGGVKEIVTDGANGFLLPPDPTPQLLAATITRYQRMDAEQRTALRSEAYATWQRHFDARTNYPAFADDLLELGNLVARRARMSGA